MNLGDKLSELRRVIKLRVKSLNDLARMAASVVALGQPTYIIKYRNSGRVVYGLLAIFRDYFNLYGLPLLYYYTDDEGRYPEGNYILIKGDEGGERVEISKSMKAGYISIPIVELVEVPEFLV